jgi:metallo-beta-lactamase family protein
MRIQFCGAAQTVTGSAHLLTLDDGYKILLDCGLYQGSEEEMEHFNKRWLFKPEDVDLLILSHAHIDHSGRIPQLYKDGFRGDIICTHATRSLCAIMLLDSAMIQQYDAEKENERLKKRGEKPSVEPLYSPKHVHEVMQNFVTFAYGKWQSIHPNVDCLFTDAGHILGSATVNLKVRENKELIRLGFTGDIGRPDRPILRDPVKMPESDFLLCESTYGDRLHESKPDEKKHLLGIIEETCVQNNGKLIIPAFSVGRTQEIVYMLDQMASNGELPHIPVFVDSPLAINATTIYGSHPECYDDLLNTYLLEDDDPFGFNSLHYVRSVEGSKALNSMESPGIIISASGMMTAGRIRHHMFNHLRDANNTFLIVGYCAPGTAGAILKSGVEELKLFGKWVPVRAKIQTMDSFSAHADKNELLDYIENQKQSCKRLYLVHGEYEPQQSFAELLEENGFSNVHIPKLGKAYELSTNESS